MDENRNGAFHSNCGSSRERFMQLRDGLAGIDIGGRAVVREHVGLHFTQIVTRCEQAEDMT